MPRRTAQARFMLELARGRNSLLVSDFAARHPKAGGRMRGGHARCGQPCPRRSRERAPSPPRPHPGAGARFAGGRASPCFHASAHPARRRWTRAPGSAARSRRQRRAKCGAVEAEREPSPRAEVAEQGASASLKNERARMRASSVVPPGCDPIDRSHAVACAAESVPRRVSRGAKRVKGTAGAKSTR